MTKLLRGRADLVTNLTDETNGIDMSNVTSLSTRPKILVNGNDASDTGGSYVSGTLDLEREIYRPDRLATVYRNERYVIPATFKIVDQSSETNFREIMEEIDLVLTTYSLDQTHSYVYEFSIDNVIADRGEILAELSFVMTKKFVDVTA